MVAEPVPGEKAPRAPEEIAQVEVRVAEKGTKEEETPPIAAAPVEIGEEKKEALRPEPPKETPIPPVAAKETERRVVAGQPKTEIPQKAETQPKAAEPEEKESAAKKGVVKLPKKEDLLEKEEMAGPAPGKKKVFGKKRRVIEERYLMKEEEVEEEPVVEPEKEEPVPVKSFRPMKKKVVLKTAAKKTEVTVPKPSRGSSGLQRS